VKGDRVEALVEYPQRETVLEPGDLITHVSLPKLPAGGKSAYLKLRDRASYEFALASAAIVMKQGANGRIDFIRVALGGIGTEGRPARLIIHRGIFIGSFWILMAERQGFEPWIPCGIHAFQACAFSHSAISPRLTTTYVKSRLEGHVNESLQ
jgi:hypothetical protein